MRTWSQLGAEDEFLKAPLAFLKLSWASVGLLGEICEPLSVGPSAQNFEKETDSNHAGGGIHTHCLRFANPAEVAMNFERPLTP